MFINIKHIKRPAFTVLAISPMLFGMMLFSYKNSPALADELKIATIDTSKIIESSLGYKDIISQIHQKQKTIADLIQKEDSKLKKKYQELETKKKVLSEAAINTKSDEITKEGEKLEKYAFVERSLLEKAYSDSVKTLTDKLSEIVTKYAESEKYNVIIERRALSYAKNSMDVTQKMLDEMNKNLPTVKVHFTKSTEIDNSRKTSLEMKSKKE